MKRLMYLTLAALMVAGCAKKNDSGKEAATSYSTALEDSVRNITAEIDSCNNVAASLSEKVGGLLPEFRAVENSREVEGYTIFQGWEKKYPLETTGLVARLSANRQLELVAALKGGVFDQIRVEGPSVTATTAVVPNDQALNYRREGLTTVMFSGDEADTVARLIADNELNPLTVTFLEGGRPTGSWRIHNANAKMITMTYLLYSANKEQAALHHRAMMLGEKLKVLRQHSEKAKERIKEEK